jgi:PAS domain S-box-containing protein
MSILSVLILEDSPSDAELMIQALLEDGLEVAWDRVETEHDYLARLGEAPDLILSSYYLARFDAPRALAAMHARDLRIPFIVVTHAVGDEKAAACVRQGAADYLLKDHLCRLGAAVRRALDEQGSRRRSNEHARLQAAMLDAAGQAMIATDPRGAVTYWNRAAEALYGWSSAEVLGRDIMEITPTTTSAAQAEEIMKALNRGEAWSGEFMARRRDGSSFPARVTDTPIHDADGTLIGVVGVSGDNSEGKRAEQLLRESEQRYHSVIEASPDSIVLLDTDGMITLANHRAADLHGYASPEQLVGMNALGTIAPEDASRLRDEFTRALTAGAVVRVEYNAVRRDMSRFIAEATLGRVLDGAGNPAGVTSVTRDITARKEAEKALRRSEERYRQIVEVSYEGICLVTDDLHVAFVNERLAEMFGYTVEEMLGASIFLFTDDAGRIEMEERRRLTHQGIRGAREARYIRKDGSTVWAIASSTALYDAEGNDIGGLSMFTDITARKQAEEKAARHVARLSTLRTIDSAIMAGADLPCTLKAILEQVVGVMDVDAAAVLVRSAETGILEFVTGLGFTDDSMNRRRRNLGEGPAARAVLERRRIVVPDPEPEAAMQPIPAKEDGFVSYLAQPLIAKGQARGVLELCRRTSFSADPDWLDFMEAVAGQVAIAIDNAQLFEGLQRSASQLTVAYDATIEGWARALDLRDCETEGHSRRVTELTLTLARAMGVGDDLLVQIRRGALLHDIGKMGIPDYILLKPGPLTEEEWTIMRRHPRFAYELLRPITYLRPALDIPYLHHEKWDGTGYPNGLAGEEIPLTARIFAVVDVWDALRSDRPYRAAWPAEKVRDHIRALAGSHFEPAVVETFLSLPLFS